MRCVGPREWRAGRCHSATVFLDMLCQRVSVSVDHGSEPLHGTCCLAIRAWVVEPARESVSDRAFHKQHVREALPYGVLPSVFHRPLP
jgi:hypothetical protein